MIFSSVIDMIPSCEGWLPGLVDTVCDNSPQVITDFFSNACQIGGDGASLLGKNICPILANAAPSLLYVSAGVLALTAAASLLRARPHSLQASLDLWVNESPEGERGDRETARERILAFINDQNSDSLSLRFLGLSSLPDIFDNEHVCQRLKVLDLSGNHLTSLPVTIGNLGKLRELYLSYNLLTALPATIGNLGELRELYLFSNFLRSLPATIGNLGELRELYLSYNQNLTGLPTEIFHVGGEGEGRCIIDLESTGLSEAVRGRLRERTGLADYIGPQFHYSMEHHEAGVVDTRSLEEVLGSLYQIAEKESQALGWLDRLSGEQKASLRVWLSRMSRVADFNGPNQKIFVNKILSYVEGASENNNFRATFFAVVNGAADTCGDRIALSILHLGIAYDLLNFNLNKIKELAEFLKRGVWAIKLLENIAREKVPTLPLVDEIEVYLGYPVKLKERLRLPISIDDMLYFCCSFLTDDDLNEAQALVEAQLDNPEEYHNFLIKEDKWKKALKARFPEDYENMEKVKRDSIDEDDEPDYVAIGEAYNAELLELTRRALA